MKTVYIAGPMCGVAFYNFPAFFDAEARWKEAGWLVVNPARLDEERDGFTPGLHAEFASPEYCTIERTPHGTKYYLWRDLPYLAACDAIALLPGWEKSEGARIELAVAQSCGLGVYDAVASLELKPPKMLVDPLQYARAYVPVTVAEPNADVEGPVFVEDEEPVEVPEHPWSFPLRRVAAQRVAGQPCGKRIFASGASRDTDEGKLDFDGFLSHAVLSRYAEYMHKHRKMTDGSLRDSDNWKKGIPRDQYRKSAWRHFMDWWNLHRTGQNVEEAACALLFNVMGDLHESLKKNGMQPRHVDPADTTAGKDGNRES